MTKHVQPRQTLREIVKNLETIANSKSTNQPDHIQASLWNAIEVIETIRAEEQRIDKRFSKLLEPF